MFLAVNSGSSAVFGRGFHGGFVGIVYFCRRWLCLYLFARPSRERKVSVRSTVGFGLSRQRLLTVKTTRHSFFSSSHQVPPFRLGLFAALVPFTKCLNELKVLLLLIFLYEAAIDDKVQGSTIGSNNSLSCSLSSTRRQ